MSEQQPAAASGSEEMRVFLQRVRERGGIGSEAEADVLARATVRHLGERIATEQADALTGALPEELAGELTAGRGGGGAFDRDAFVDAVAAHVHVDDHDDAERRVHAVLTTVRVHAPDGQVEGAMAQLPPELAAMFA